MSEIKKPVSCLHDEQHHRFFVPLEGYEAVLMYAKEANVLDFYHTYVPEQLREKGIAEQLVRAGFEYAKQKGFRVLPSCSYIRGHFLARNQQYLSYVVRKI